MYGILFRDIYPLPTGVKIVPPVHDDSSEEFGRTVCINENFLAVGAIGHNGYRGTVYIYTINDDNIDRNDVVIYYYYYFYTHQINKKYFYTLRIKKW